MTTANAAAIAGQTPAKSLQASYAIDPAHAGAYFKVRHLMVAHVRGELGAVTGEAVIDLRDLGNSRVDVRIDVGGIDTRNPERDAHLKSADFLDVVRFPELTFRSTEVLRGADDLLLVKGDLTLRGVTRPVTVEVELSGEIQDPWGNSKRGVTATAKLHRKEFGVSWNAAMDGGGLVVGDVVDVTIEAELVRK
jgi:polyisoprenoid-binding protein YceI